MNACRVSARKARLRALDRERLRGIDARKPQCVPIRRSIGHARNGRLPRNGFLLTTTCSWQCLASGWMYLYFGSLADRYGLR